MDLTAENQEEVNNKDKRKDSHGSTTRLRRLLGMLFSLLALFSLSFSVLYIAVFVGNLSISSPISLPSQCKIVSSSVDLRSSKVCELGFLNYKAKHVLYPSERKTFRCHYDYYWTSVFKVEYMDHSGHARLALAEAPNEALPSDCRPNFSAAWLTKDKFEVNKTYKCWYTLGISKVHIYQDGIFDCQAKDPSTIEMFIRYLILFMRILKSWYASGASSWKYFRWETMAGVIAGCCTSFISVALFGILTKLCSCIIQLSVLRRLTLPLNKVLLKRICFLVAYLSFTSWLAVQYFKRIGLPQKISGHYSM